jgi:hypothetical protein
MTPFSAHPGRVSGTDASRFRRLAAKQILTGGLK